MQPVLAEAKATLSETQPHPASSLGLGSVSLCWAPPAQPACCGYWLFNDRTSRDSGCF